MLTAAACGGSSTGPSSPPTAPTPVAPGPSTGPTRYLTGNPADVAPVLAGPAHDLGGGGTDVDDAIQWMVDAVRGCTSCATTLDVVVLRASGADGYNAPILAMRGVDSVETIVLARRQDAEEPAVAATVAAAEVVFFAGGDQCDYVTRLRGTGVQRAVDAVYARGGGVGGTSAGLAILGQYVYDACTGSVLSTEALANPYDRRVSLSAGLFDVSALRAVLTDSHVGTRDRLGRLAAFLARLMTDERVARPAGLAVDEATSVVVDRAGRARVIGSGTAWLMLPTAPPDTCVAGQPLTFRNLRLWRLRNGDTLSLPDGGSQGEYIRNIVAGRFDADPYLTAAHASPQKPGRTSPSRP